MIVLASGSAARAAMLRAAGVVFEVVRPAVDEEALKRDLRAARLPVASQADALAEGKALSVSRMRPDARVLGSDQMLETADGGWLDKPRDDADAAAQLRSLGGRTHRLHSAAVVAVAGATVWRTTATATLTMRPLSDTFIAAYLAAEAEALAGAGIYRIEGRGVQLFKRIEGDNFTIMGLPLLPLLGWLRAAGELPS